MSCSLPGTCRVGDRGSGLLPQLVPVPCPRHPSVHTLPPSPPPPQRPCAVRLPESFVCSSAPQ